MMTVAEAAESRAAAAARWSDVRLAAGDHAAQTSGLRRDQRIDEAQAIEAARPRPQDRASDRAAENRPRQSAGHVIDIVA